MRKLVFAALAGVFMLSSGFATVKSLNKQITDDFRTCTFELYVDRTDNLTGETTRTVTEFTSEVDDNVTCLQSALWHAEMVRLFMYGI